MSRIDPTARIEDGATIGDGAVIGPYCTVGRNVTIGSGCVLKSHVNIAGHTSIGANCKIFPFASLGEAPQDIGYKDEPTTLTIGEGCTIRESVTMNRGTLKGGGKTVVGARGFFMAYSHVGHDCIVGNDVIFANSGTLGGHCEIGDFVYIGGLAAVHQFVRIGPQAMIAGVSGVRGDLIPFGMASGQHAFLEGLNIIGMRRRGFTASRLQTVRDFYQRLFHGSGVFADRLEALRPMGESDPAIADMIKFIDEGKKRALMMAHNNPNKPTERSKFEA